jgi:long-chain acyl-CoA synthetase
MSLHLTLTDSLLSSVRKYPNKTAIVFEDKRFTYREFNDRVNRAANAMLALGLQKGDRVAILMGNCNEMAEMLMAAGKCGLVAVPVNFRFSSPEIEYVVTQPGCKAFFVASEYAEQVAEIRARLPAVRNYVVVGPAAVDGMDNYERLLEASSNAEPGVAVGDDDPWFIGFTSGTTGFPKGAILTHGSRTMPALYIAIEYGLRDTDVGLVVMPLFHSNGFSFTHMGLMLGNTVVIMRNFDPELVLKTIEEHRLSYVSMVPTMYTRILALPHEIMSGYDVSSMRVFISSSAPLLTRTKEDMLKFFPSSQLNEFYGSTEAGIVTNLKPRDQTRKTRCVGQPIFGIQVKILDTEGNEVPPGEVGELYSLGPCFREYHGLPDATRHAFRDGWFTAGDLARTDEEGYIYIVDRRTDLILSGGENIYPAEIEDILIRHPGIAELAIIGIPHPVWGESVHAVVIESGREPVTIDALDEFCKGRLANYKRPRSIEVVDSLPKTATGKILRRRLKDECAERLRNETSPAGAAQKAAV